MKNEPFFAFIKKILFQRISWQVTLSIFYFVTTLTLPILIYMYPLNYKNPIPFNVIGRIYAAVSIFYFSIMGIDLFVRYYLHYKKYEYRKVKPLKVEKGDTIKQKFDNIAWCNDVEERLQALEKLSPVMLTLYTFFVAVGLAIAILFIAKLIL